MKISDIIERLRLKLPTEFSDRIAGAADLQQAMQHGKMTAPCLYASILPTTATDVSQNGTNYILQEIEEVFVIYLHVPNLIDRRGQNPQEAVHAFRRAIWSALIFWNPDLDGTNDWGYKTKEIMFDGDSMAAITPERYYHAFRFRQTFQIDNECQGIGSIMPDDATVINDLLKAYTDIEPIDITDQPALEAEVNY